MSPEACESKRDIDHRTDIYALGVLLFQMMCGVLPFDGETMGEVLVKQVTALPPAPRGLNPAIPPSVEQILLRCLAKPVDARFPTMLALRDALLDPESYLRGSPPIAPARSVAPGEAVIDGRQALAAADARTRMMQSDGLPLQAPGEPYGTPGKSRQMAVPGLAQSIEPKMNTMRIDTPHGYSSRPPRRVWPIVLVVGLLLGLGGGAFAVAWFGRDGGGEAVATPADASTAVVAKIDASAVVVAKVDAATVVTTADGATTDAGIDAASGIAVASVDAPVAVASVDAAAAPSVADAAPAVVAATTVKLTIDSEPRGATVVSPGGVALGNTPLKLEWPTATAPVTFVLKLRGYRDKSAALTVTSNTMTRVDLERIPRATNPGRGSGSGSGRKDDTSLERPD